MADQRVIPSIPGWHLLLIVVLGLTLGGLYFASIDLRDPEFAYGVHERILVGDAGSPYRYRVLVPVLLEALSGVFMTVVPRANAFLGASAVYVGASLVLQLLALYVLFRQWFSPTHSLIGVLYTSGVTIATFGYFSYQPWSILEVAFFSMALVLGYHGRWALAGVVVVLASLNRETGVFIALALFLATLNMRHPLDLAGLRASARARETQLTFAYTVLSVAIFALLRVQRGCCPEQAEVMFVLTRNLLPEQLMAAGISIPLFFGIGWIFAALGVPHGPPYILRAARVLPFYLVAFLLWGWWRETRILTTIYPIFIPLILAYCYAPIQRLAASSRNQ